MKECCIIMAALCLLAGILIGAFIQRVVICIAVGKLNPSLCDKCKWLHTNARWIEADRWAKAERKSRHKSSDSLPKDHLSFFVGGGGVGIR